MTVNTTPYWYEEVQFSVAKSRSMSSRNLPLAIDSTMIVPLLNARYWAIYYIRDYTPYWHMGKTVYNAKGLGKFSWFIINSTPTDNWQNYCIFQSRDESLLLQSIIYYTLNSLSQRHRHMLFSSAKDKTLLLQYMINHFLNSTHYCIGIGKCCFPMPELKACGFMFNIARLISKTTWDNQKVLTNILHKPSCSCWW